MKVSDAVAAFVESLGIKHVFGVCGGGAMHLNDSFRDSFIPMHHEQAAAMAADAYGRLHGMGCILVTTGPGGTNAITGIACSWVDSTPVLAISGQVTRDTLLNGHGVRQFGIQETDIVPLVASITKYAVTVKDEKKIRYELEKAAHISCSGRPGPVWVDIPLDIQAKQVEWSDLRGYTPPQEPKPEPFDLAAITAERPVLVIGNGVHLAYAEEDCRRFAQWLGIPVLSSWAAADIMPDDPLYIGSFGLFGDRASNFTVQNADLLLVLGCRLSIAQTGHNTKAFAPNAKIIMVDVDEREMSKPSLRIKRKVHCDVGHFMRTAQLRYECAPWVKRCQGWKTRYKTFSGASFDFIARLSEELPDDAVVVTDMGTSFTCTFQSARMKRGQRWFTASGHAPMGYGLPGAIGAHYATGRKVTAIVGDGGLQFNVQELQTIAHNKLPIEIYVLNNDGYLTMKHTQLNHFGRLSGSDPSSGVSCPSTAKIAAAYGVNLREVFMPADQPLVPRVQTTKLPDGTLQGGLLEDMYPYLPREEFEEAMRCE